MRRMHAIVAITTAALLSGCAGEPDGGAPGADASLWDAAAPGDAGPQITYGSCADGGRACGPEAECLRVRVLVSMGGAAIEERIANECTQTCESPADCPPVPNYPDQPVSCRSFGGAPALCFVRCEDGFPCLQGQDCLDMGGEWLCVPHGN